MQRLDVCICTHNPRRDVLAKVARSIASQTASREAFRVVIVDNCSSPEVTASDFQDLLDVGIEFEIVREPVLGLTRARLRAISVTRGNWILFVDDDNELASDYIAAGLAILAGEPDLGCFGGKLLLPDCLSPQSWVQPFLPYLGIKDAGDQVITSMLDSWGDWEPPGAGAWVRRPLLELYSSRVLATKGAYRLGRNGTASLASCDDSMLMRGAARLRLFASYQPTLVLHHHLDPRRFRLDYLVRLLYSYGVSHVVLENVLRGSRRVPDYYQTRRQLIRLCTSTLAKHWAISWRYALCMAVYHLGAFNECHRRDPHYI
jgi:glycosyltransferase involved in cell wall biosynthesis